MISQNGTRPTGETLSHQDALEVAYHLGRAEGKIDAMLTAGRVRPARWARPHVNRGAAIGVSKIKGRIRGGKGL